MDNVSPFYRPEVDAQERAEVSNNPTRTSVSISPFYREESNSVPVSPFYRAEESTSAPSSEGQPTPRATLSDDRWKRMLESTSTDIQSNIPEDTPESRFYTSDRLEKIRRYYALRGDNFSSDEDMIEKFEWDRAGRDINTIAIGAELSDAYTGTDEEKAALADVREIWEDRPGIFRMPNADDWGVFNQEGRGFEGIGENLIWGILDPTNLLGFGVAKGATVAAGQTAGRAALNAGLKVGALNAAVDAGISGAAETALQNVDVETGRKEEVDWAQVGIASLTGGAVSFGVNAPVATAVARRGISQNASQTASDIAAAAAADPEVDAFVKGLTPQNTTAQRAKSVISSISNGDWWKQKTLDRFRSIAKLDETIDPNTDFGYGPLYREMRLTENSGKMAESAVGFHGITAGVPKVVDPTNLASEFTGTNINLRNVFESLESPADAQAFTQWIAANRMKSLRAAGKEIDPRFTDKAIDEIISIGDANPAFREAAKKYGEYNKALMQFALDTNVISKESYDNIISAATRANDPDLEGAFYIPFFRMEDFAGEARLRGSGADAFGMKGFRGGELQEGQTIADLLESTVINTASIIEAGVRNRAKLNIITAIEQNSLPGLMSRAAPNNLTKMTRSIDEVKNAILKNITDPAEQVKVEKALDDASSSFGEDFLEFYSRSTKYKPEDGMEVVLRDGKLEYWKVEDELLLDSLQSLGPDPAQLVGFAGRVGQFAKGLLTETVTTFPTFAARGFFRDTQSAVVLSKTRGAKRLLPVIDAVDAIFNTIRKTPEYEEFILNGGGFSSIRLQEGQLSSRTMADVVRTRGATPALAIQGATDLKNLASLAWEKYTRGLSAIENANRFAEYKKLRQQGWSVRDATLASRNVGTDFAMRGSSPRLRAFMSMVPFLNAGLQGLYVAARNVDSPESRANTLVKALLTTTIPAIGLYIMNQEYDVIQNAVDSDKDLNFLIPVDAEGNPYPDPEDAVSYVKIPKSYDVGVLAGSLVERLSDNKDVRNLINWATQDEALNLENSDTTGETLAHLYRLVTDIMLLNPTPQIAVPAMGLLQNETWTGAPIVGPDLERLAPEQQFDETTPYWARGAGDMLGLSPKQLEFAVEAYTGTWGGFLSDMIDRAYRGFSAGDQAPDLPAMELGQLPVVSAFLPSSRTPQQFEIDFFRFLNRAGQESALFDKLRTEGRMPELNEIMQEDSAFAKKVQASKQLQSAYRKLSQVNKQVDRILRDTKTNAEEKQQQIEGLRELRRDILEQFMDVVNSDQDLRQLSRAPRIEGRIRMLGDSLDTQTEEAFSD